MPISDLTDMTGTSATTAPRIAIPGTAVMTPESGEPPVTGQATTTGIYRIATIAEIIETATEGNVAGAGNGSR